MLVNIQNIQVGDVATPNLFNSRFAALAEVINGNVDSDNLRNGAVTRSKIAQGAIDSSKLDIQKYVDANGWTVTDLGGIKTYTRSIDIMGTQTDFNNTKGKLIAGNGARDTLGEYSVPVGRTADNISVNVSYFGIYSGHLVVSGELRNGKILIAGGNIYPSPLAFSGKVFIQAQEI